MLIFFILVSFLSSPVFADIIQLKNGNAIETKILKEDENFVTAETVDGKVKIPKRDIQTLWRGNEAQLMEVRGKDVYFSKGVELYKEGKFREAAAKFERALGPAAPNAIIYANIGSSYASLGEAKKAEANFLVAIEKRPDDPDILLNLANLYESQKDFKRAIRYYEKLAALQPENMNAQRSLAYCGYVTGDFLTAARIYEMLGQKNDVVASCNAAAAYIQAGELDKAEAVLEPLLESSFPHSRAYTHMGTICRLRKDYIQAEAWYQKALSWDPKDPQIPLGLGQLYLEKGAWDRAEVSFGQVLKKDPQNPMAIYGLAQTFAKKKESAKAVGFFEQLLAKDPRDPALLNEKGLLYLKMNEPRKALEVYQGLFKIDDGYAKGHANAGLAYAFIGDADNALKEWDRALELDPRLEAAAQNKKLLEDAMRGNTDAGKQGT